MLLLLLLLTTRCVVVVVVVVVVSLSIRGESGIAVATAVVGMQTTVGTPCRGYCICSRAPNVCVLSASSSSPSSVRPSVIPSVLSLVPSVVPSCGIQAKKWSNFHQCFCPTYVTDPVVYFGLARLLLLLLFL